MKVIVYTNEDGHCSVVRPVANRKIEDVAKKAVPEGTKYVIVDEKAVPSDRHFRNAWILKDGTIHRCRKKARKLHMGQLRKLRDAKLAELDIQVIKALENGEDLGPLRELKQKLRDMPKEFKLDHIKDLEELKAACPKELK